METRVHSNSNDAPSTSPRPIMLRIPKACNECRQRKIKCDAAFPCSGCKWRNRECVYRDVARPRRREAPSRLQQEHQLEAGCVYGDDDEADSSMRKRRGKRMRSSSLSVTASASAADSRKKCRVHYHSVAATHLASPSCELQLYYGPTSNFSLMQQVYRHLTTNTAIPNVGAVGGLGEQAPGDDVEEAGPGLDLFSFRRLFFGDMGTATSHSPAKVQPLMFLEYELAEMFLQRYLATTYHFTPFLQPEEYHTLLKTVYAGTDPKLLDSATFVLLLLCMAMGATMTDHGPWGETLFQKAKDDSRALDDVVNLQAIQAPLLMALYQTENGKPNSAFLYMGTASRKAFAAGLHKGVNLRSDKEGRESKATLWSLYYYETWVSFTFGRRSSLVDSDISIPDPTDETFIYPLVELARIISNTASRIYGNNHNSLLSVWRAADQTFKELRCFSRKHLEMDRLKPYIPPEKGEEGFKQAGLMTAYCHTVLLTFRPFLVFRVKRKLKRSPEKGNEGAASSTEVPQWLNAACEYALEAARYAIRFITHGCELNDLIREHRYNSFFLEGACFSLIYDSLLYSGAESPHLPWIKAALRCISTMIPKNDSSHQTSNVFTAIYKMYLATCPETNIRMDDLQGGVHVQEWVGQYDPQSGTGGLHGSAQNQNTAGKSGTEQWESSTHHLQGSMEESLPDIASQWGLQGETDWDFNFPTMDLETFLSVDPTAGSNEGLFDLADPFSTLPSFPQ